MKERRRITLFVYLALLCSLMGCRPLAMGKGSLILRVPTNGIPGKTISPGLDLGIVYCDIYGTGPEAAEFTQSQVTESTVLQEHLAAGPWTISVEAFNADDVQIGSGSIGVTIAAGETASRSVEIAPLSGTGTLDVVVSWPSGAIADPGLSGTLTPAGGSPQSLSFTSGTDAFSCSSSDLVVGYYSLILQLSDDAVVEWGSFEAVRILNGEVTTASFELTLQDLLSGG